MDKAAFVALVARVEERREKKDLLGAKKLLEATPFKGQPGWHHMLARLCLDLEDVVHAVHHATKAVSLAPKNAHYRALLAACLYAASAQEPIALDVAEIEAWNAIEIDPETPSAQNTLGLVHLAKGRRSEARACFERAVKSAPADAAAQHNLLLVAA